MKKDIEGYEGLYEVYDSGEIYALKRTVINKNGEKQNYPRLLLKQGIFSINKLSYKRVGLSKNGIVKHNSVHRVIAKAFIPNPENKPFVNHIDNNGLNNSIDNLEWCTHQENMIHAQKQGRLFNSQSRAGKAAGILSKEKKVKRVNAEIGNVFGHWKLLSCDESKRKAYAFCKCLLCGREQSVYFLNLKKGNSTMCKSCAIRKRYEDARNLKI